MELVRSQNANAISEFYLLKVFLGGGILKIFFFKFSFSEENAWKCSCSTSSRAGTRLTVHRVLPYRTAVFLKRPVPAQIRNVGREYSYLNDTLHLSYLFCFI